MVDIVDNLYLLTVPLVKGKSECDIEDLFDDGALSQIIDGKEFTKENDYDHSKYYGKEIFSKYVESDYSNINFDRFKSVLDNMNFIIDTYKKEHLNKEHSLDTINTDNSNKDQVPLEI